MAFYDDQDDINSQDPNAQQQPQQTSGQSSIISGQGGSPGQGSQGAASANTNTPDNPGNFVGIKQYLDANKSQSSKLGDQVSGQIQNTIQGAHQDVDALSSKFRQEADSGQIANIQNAVNEAKGITDTAATGNAGAVSQDQTQRFGEIANAQYQGPNALIETDLYEPTYAKIKQAQSYSDLSKDESGSQQLLKDIYKDQGTNYTSGQNRLDSYLLNSQENRQKLSDARVDAGNLEQDFANADLEAAQYAANQKALADSTREAARQNLISTQTDRNSQIEAELNAISKDWKSEYNEYLNLLKNSNNGQNLQLTDEQAARLGVDKGQRIYNLLNSKAGNTAEQYLTMQEFDPNKVISKDQQAQLAALDQLAGTFGGALQNKYTQANLAETLDKATAFAADKFGLSAKQADEVFNAASKIANMVAEASSGANIWTKTLPVQVAREVTERVVKSLPWPLSDIVNWVTRTVYDTVSYDVQAGHVDANATTEGTVADYLAGKAPTTETGGTKSLDLGTFVDPTYLLSDKADKKIDQLQGNLKNQTQQQWVSQIEKYLRDAGYYNQVK